MSMVSRRTFLKCIGAGSAAIASAALLGGCSGSNSSSSSSTSSGNNSSGGGNTSNGNTGSSSSSSSNTNNSASSGTTNSITGDIGKGKQYRPMTSVPIKDYDQNIANDQNVEIMLTLFQNGTTVDDDGYVSALFYFTVTNDSEKIRVPLENPYGDFTQKELMNFSENAFSGKYEPKYMEVKCGTRRVQAAVLSGDSSTVSSALAPGESGTILLLCRFPKDWTSATVKYTLPYDTKKYVNFIVYPSDSYSG